MAKKATSKNSALKKNKVQHNRTPISKAKDLPATQEMVHHLQKMMKADIKSLEKKVDARFNQVDARFNQVDARFNQVESKIEKVLSEVHRMAILMEEQNAKNNFVLDGYEQIYKRLDRVETDVDKRLHDMEVFIAKSNKTEGEI